MLGEVQTKKGTLAITYPS